MELALSQRTMRFDFCAERFKFKSYPSLESHTSQFRQLLTEFSHVFAFIVLAILFVAGGLVTSFLLRPKNPNTFKLAAYECGEDSIGGAWVKFNIRYYVVALIFILFDVEILFLFPWALVFKAMGWLAVGEMFTFIGILLVGYIYVWGKGDLEWARPKPFVARLKDVVTVPNSERAVTQRSMV